MTVLFRVQNFHTTKEKVFKGKHAICKISSKNIIAFNRRRYDDVFLKISSTVCVCDILTPWECFTVCKHESDVRLIEWDKNGECLLVVFEGGDIELWKSQSWSINTWELQYKTSLNGHNIIGIHFFHDGEMTHFNSQKKDLLPFSSCERLHHCATLTKMGNSSTYGFIAVTFTGFVGAYYLPTYSNDLEKETYKELVKTASISLVLQRDRIEQCHIYTSTSGIVNVCFVYESRKNCVYCTQMKVEFDYEGKITLRSQKIPQIILDQSTTININNVRWILLGNEESLLVSYTSEEGSFLEQMILIKQHEPVHKLLKKNNAEMYTRLVWNSINKVQLKTKVKDIRFSSFPCDYFPIYLVLVDNSFQFFEGGINGLTHFVKEPIKDEKLLGQQIIATEISALNQIMLVLDNYGSMYALQLFNPFQEKNFKPNNLSLSVALLEYSIKAGIDASDVLLTNLNLLDVLMEKLTDNFTRQQPSVKQYYYSGFLSIKSNICRIQTKHKDFDNLIRLHSISITFKSLLRPSELNTQEKAPGENLPNILNEFVPDIDKVLCNLDARDFTVEPSTLQSLQQIIQWVTDLTIIMLHRLPDEIIKSKLIKKQGYDLCKDMIAINTIRELLVIVRIWGLLNTLCLPVYTKSMEMIDVLSIIFRILTRIAQNGGEPDDVILDECNQLSSQVIIPEKLTSLPLTIFSLNNLVQKTPYQFTSSVEPITNPDSEPEKPFFSREVKDGVINILLGPDGCTKMQCIRCGSINSINKIEKTTAIKAWYNRWKVCHCGGYWKNIPL